MENQYAKQRTVKDIKNDDSKVQITGNVKKVVDKDTILLNDTTGDIKVNIKDIKNKPKEKSLVNVIGNLEVNTKGEKALNAEIIQDMNNLNFKYYLRLYDLKKTLIKKAS